MENSAASLTSQILTASPQRLRLLLIENAIRFAEKAVVHWDAQQNEEGMQAVGNCRHIINELLNGIKPDGSQLSRQISSIYLFLFRALVEAQLRRDRIKLEEVLRVLLVERETWQSVCDLAGKVPTQDETCSATVSLDLATNNQSNFAVGVDLQG